MASERKLARVGLALGGSAFLLAWSAVAVRYYRHGAFDIAPAVGGILSLALAVSYWLATLGRAEA